MSIVTFVRPRQRARILAGDLPAWLRRHPRKDYIIAVCVSAPPWCDVRRLRELRDEARLRTKATGVRYVLDHDIPVTHPHVCGLTVPANMVVMDWRTNQRKGNRWPWTGDLFSEPEQLSML